MQPVMSFSKYKHEKFCKDCYVPMIGVMEFLKDKHEKFCSPKKHRKLNDSEITFGEVLSKELKK